MYTPTPQRDCCGDFFIIDGNIKTTDKFKESALGKGISFYEVLKVKDKTPLFTEDHINRLLSSARLAGVRAFPQPSFIKENIRLLITQNPFIIEGNVRVLLYFSGSLKENPNIYSYYIPHYYPSEEQYAEGIPLVLVHAERNQVHSKIMDLDFRSFIAREVKKFNAFEALLVNRDGFITEGSKSNFFMISNNKIITPPVKDVLPGITRKYILGICKKSGIKTEEAKIHYTRTGDYESCFISGTSPGVIAGKNIGPTLFLHDHPLLKELKRKYELLVDNYIALNKPVLNK